MTDNDNNAVSDYPFRLSAIVRTNSGGHDHNTDRPTGKFITSAKDTVATFQDTTNSEGKATYTYICSGFGGVDSIFVRGRTDRDTSTATILLQISGLQELTSGDHYALVGAHSQGTNSLHEKNHYGTASAVSKLQALADSAYADSSWTVQYNDMSLINGGPFDFTQNWDTPHQLHREGVSVDVSDPGLSGRGVGVDYFRNRVIHQPFNGVLSYERRLRHFHLSFRR